ncbi:MAG: type II toxin-antitoxin system prevent-host-death family antitoxin [Myxococcota bacterium]|nr:type II toxin-antitoxin system prevent-host-death family antitoxin [Myxococcota bacterium]
MDDAKPTTVGSRELKTRLGTYLKLVQRGVRLIVTDRGRPVAELRPLSRTAADLDSVMEELMQLGEVTRRSPKFLRPFKPISVSGVPVSKTLLDDREDRV